MKLRALLTGLAVVMLLGAADQPTLKEFTSKEGGFSVLLPGEPRETVKSIKAPDGKTEVQRTYVCAPDPKTVYLVLEREMRALANAGPEAAKKTLEAGCKSAEEVLKGKLISKEPITLGKHPGLEFRIESKDGVYRARAYIVNGRMYQVTLTAPKDVVNSKAADEYLGSFKLREKE
jgi:hypothetical protein